MTYHEIPTELNARQLEWADIPRRGAAVPGLLPRGTVTVMASATGVGKSTTLQDWAIGVASGEGCLGGGFDTNQGAVLFVSTEDDMELLQRRQAGLLADRDPGSLLTYKTDLPPLANGGHKWIDEWAEREHQPAAVFLDLFHDLRGERRSSYDADRVEIGKLKELAQRWNLAILVTVHPHRRVRADAPFDSIWPGIAGACATKIVMDRPPGADSTTTLYLRSKDGDNIIAYRMKDGRFQFIGGSDGIRVDVPRPAVTKLRLLAVLAECGSSTPEELAAVTHIKQTHVRLLLGELRQSGQVLTNGGAYRLAPAAPRLVQPDGLPQKLGTQRRAPTPASVRLRTQPK